MSSALAQDDFSVKDVVDAVLIILGTNTVIHEHSRNIIVESRVFNMISVRGAGGIRKFRKIST